MTAQNDEMDFTQFIKDPDKQAKSLVRKITHAGETDLSKDDLQELKQICKNCGNNVMIAVYKELLKCLQKQHSQVRVSTVKLIDYLFQKSHIIRERLLDDFNIFLELALAITQKPKVKLKLPPPKKYAALLQELSSKCIHKWHSDFGEGYEKLRYAHRFLREHKLVDFSRFQVRTHEQLIQQQKLAERQEKILSRTIDNKLTEFRELKPEIEHLLAQIESLIDILVPENNNNHNVSGDIIGPTDDQNSTNIHQQRQHGIANLSQSIEIQFSPYVEVKKNQENKEIVSNLKELKRELIGGKLVKLVAIEKTLNKRSDQLINTLKEIIDIKTRATNIVLKLGELKIVDEPNEDQNRSKPSSTIDRVDSESDSDNEDDFQEVEPKEDLETYIPKSMRYEYGLEPIDPRELRDKNKSLTLTDESFVCDIVPSSSSHDDATIVLSCNVRLDSGKLCPRRDKIKCPFHGKIIPRDHNGVPLNEEDRLEEERQAKRRPQVPEWQDPELLADIRAATGVDLTMPKKRTRNLGPKKNLANTKTCDETPKQRIERRLKKLIK